MPYGKGTYGKQMGRPKKTMKKKVKIVMGNKNKKAKKKMSA
tara:strand:+ start:622 stop:744 length:123 start_codon:yes stop_codon:yes gene_type:complete